MKIKDFRSYKKFALLWGLWLCSIHTCFVGARGIIPPPLPSFKIIKKANPEPSSAPMSPQTPAQPAYRELIALKIQEQTTHSLKLFIPNRLNLKMVAYVRGSQLYVFLDKEVVFNFKELDALNKQFVMDMEQSSIPQGSFLKINLSKGTKVISGPEEYGWNLIFTPEASLPSSTTQALLQVKRLQESESSVTFEMKDQGQSIAYEDPVVQDKLFLIPVRQGAWPSNLETPNYKFIKTIQGIVVQAISKNMNLQQDKDSFTLNVPSLYLSSPQDRQRPRSVPQIPPLFTFKSKSRNYDHFYQQQNQLTKDAIASQGLGKSKVRLQGIKFYLDHQMPQEALGLLSLLKQESPSLMQQPEILALKGLAQGLSGQYQKSLESFHKSQLENEPEIKLWRGLFNKEIDHQETALSDILENIAAIQTYPLGLQNYIYLRAAEKSLSLHHPAQILVDKIKKSLLTPDEKEQYSFIQALNLKENGNLIQAEATFKSLLQSPYPYVQAQSAYELSLLLEQKGEKVPLILQILEDYRCHWRSDPIEVKILRRLAQLYLKNNQIPEALRRLQQLMIYYPNTKAAADADFLIQSTISHYIIENKENSSYQKLIFYEEFQKYSPQDQRKYKILQTLGECYVDLNLIDKAEEIFLTILPFFKEDPEAQGQLMLKLAFAQFQENKEEKALETLKSIDTLALKKPETISYQRQLHARILTRQKNYEEALKVLEEDLSSEALYQKADIAMASDNWPRAAAYLRVLISKKENKGDLTPDIVLNLATAYYHAQQHTELKNLRQKYLPFMLKSPLAASFSLITETNELSQYTPEDIAQQVQKSKDFEQHLNNYLKKKDK